MKYAQACILFIFFIHLKSVGQSIAGRVMEGGSNIPIPVAYLKIYSLDGDNATLSETALIQKGKFHIILRHKYSTFRIEVSANGYQPENRTLAQADTSKHYQFNFYLTKVDYKVLGPVEVKARPRPIVIKNDTTTYNINEFKDGTERKLEDILKKLPGIQVNEKTGEVKFKGKAIEKMLIEGDDLFGRNYSLGTKNISADMIEGVQAIENFSDNYVLKSIEKDEKVALNLQLTKAKTKINGVVDIGSGLFSTGKLYQDYNLNAIGINAAHKFFSTLSYNNVGINRSPVDYFGSNMNVEQADELSLFNKRFIDDMNFSTLVDEGRASFNNQFFGNYNGLFKLGRKTSMRLNVTGIKDNMKNQQHAFSKYYVVPDTVINIDSTPLQKKPASGRFDLYIRNNISPKALFEYTGSLRLEEIHSNRGDYTNYNPFFESNLQSKSLFVKNELTYSRRIARKTAFQLLATHAFHKPDQQFFISPAVYYKPDLSANLQNINQRKNTVDVAGNLLGNYRFGNYLIGLKASLSEINFNSILNSDSAGINTSDFPNNADYQKKLLQQKNSISFKRNSWNINASVLVNYLIQDLRNRIKPYNQSKTTLFLEPAISTSVRLSYYSRLTLSVAAMQKPNLEGYIFENNVLQGIRSIAANIPSLNLDKSKQASLMYAYNDLYNQFDVNTGISYQERKGGYLPYYLISQSVIVSSYQYYNIQFNNADLFVSSSKYIPAILSTIKMAVNLSRFRYNNFVNADSMRQNTSYAGGVNLLYKTLFKRGINFHNSIVTNTNIAKNSNNHSKTSITQLQNQFRLILNVRKTFTATATWDCIIPDADNFKNNYNFIDATFSYKPVGKKYEVRAFFRNLIDQRSFQLFDISDYYFSTLRINTIPMQGGLFFSYSF